MIRITRTAAAAVVLLGVLSGCYIEHLSGQEYEALRVRMTQACSRALPETPPTPVLRECGDEIACFSCVDERGMLHPVYLPCPQGKRFLEAGDQWIGCDH